jgi:hypothetical protein
MKASIEKAVTHELDTLFARGEPPPATAQAKPAKGPKGNG